MDNDFSWAKTKGYIHFTGQLNYSKNLSKIISYVSNPINISKHGFFPLLHRIIKERRFKKISESSKKKAHSSNENGKHIRSIKNRPLHYSTHIDAAIFGYYSSLIIKKYEEEVKADFHLDSSIVGYRKIPIINTGKNKGTAHFAKEVFDEIKIRSNKADNVHVLAFDIKNFFPSLDHHFLKSAWINLFGFDNKLPNDHFAVYKAATKFSYVLLNDLRLNGKFGFDEKKLAENRKKYGIHAFFSNSHEFRCLVKSGQLKLYKNPFGQNKGIPQGLPISSTLANLYLLSFDKTIIERLVKKYDVFYRRYSDDIIVICDSNNCELIKEFIYSEIEKYKLEISKSKTESFIFKMHKWGNKPERLTCFCFDNNSWVTGRSLKYLGYSFNGTSVFIKENKLSRFYRRIIYSIKAKSRIVKKSNSDRPEFKNAIFLRQIKRLYMMKDLSKTTVRKRWKYFSNKNEFGYYQLITGEKTKKSKGSYLNYVKRSSEILNAPEMIKQIRNYKKIFWQAYKIHWVDKNINTIT